MECNCLIGIQHLDAKVEYIYVNWDGDMDHVGKNLFTHFTTRNKVLDLIWTGSRQALDAPDFMADEVFHAPKMVKTLYDFFAIKDPKYKIDYYYLFTADNSWALYDPIIEKVRPLFTYFHPSPYLPSFVDIPERTP
jgi:hypothetical protein